MARSRLLAAALGIAVALTACTAIDAPPGSGDDGEGTPPPDVTGTVTVFAAASLTEAFEELAARFERAHPSAEVVLSFGGSSGLAAQLADGAPADVFAPANEATMQPALDAGAVGDPVVFAGNTLEIVVPAGNPAGVSTLADLADPALAVALCDIQVPCGAATQELFDAAGFEPAPDTLEPDVRSVLTKVSLGEADAGVVYVTDVRAGGDAVEGVAVPEAAGIVNRYPIALVAHAPNPAGGRAFLELVLSPEGQGVLAGAGFLAP